MKLEYYLKHRRKFEVLSVIAIFSLFGVLNATSIIIENVSDDLPADAMGAWALEFSSVAAILLIIPAIIVCINRVDSRCAKLRDRILWHVAGWVFFSLLHTILIYVFRTLLWASVGETYEFGPPLLTLLFEMRKDLLAYIAIVATVYAYRFIIDRLQGEAKFLSVSDQLETKQSSTFKPAYKSQFLVKMLNQEFLVKVDDIDWIRSASNYVLMNCGERSYPMRQTLTNLCEQLNPTKFMRVHRTAIVNLDHVQTLGEHGDLHLELLTGETVPVSKTYLPNLKQALTAMG